MSGPIVVVGVVGVVDRIRAALGLARGRRENNDRGLGQETVLLDAAEGGENLAIVRFRPVDPHLGCLAAISVLDDLLLLDGLA